MTYTDICAIIQACGEYRVSSFCMGDMTIVFDTGEDLYSEEDKVYDNTVLEPEEVINDEPEEDIYDSDLFEDPLAWEKAELERIENEQ